MALIPIDKLIGGNGHKRTKSLFIEMCTSAEIDNPPFTLNRFRQDDKYIKLGDLYIAHCVLDPSETSFAEEVFGDVGYWSALKQATWIQTQYQEWQETATIKRKALAFKAMTNEVMSGGKSAFSAAKYLIEEPWVDKRKPDARKRSKKTTEAAAADPEFMKDLESLRERGALN